MKRITAELKLSFDFSEQIAELEDDLRGQGEMLELERIKDSVVDDIFDLLIQAKDCDLRKAITISINDANA